MRKSVPAAIAAFIVVSLAPAASAGETPSPPGARVFFVNLRDGDILKGAVVVKMGIEGMALAPAGTQAPDSGHHHLLVDAPTPEGEALNEALPTDDNHRHFGKAQTEATIELAPGPHTLQLVLGDWSHVPHNPPVVSERITVTVVE
jgi:hypothetical protein